MNMLTAPSLRPNARNPASWLAAGAVIAIVWIWQFLAMRETAEWLWLPVSGALIAAGFAALGRLRPARIGLTAAQTMLLLGGAGMLVGLAVDARHAGLAALAALCAGAPAAGVADTLALHWQWLPAMHAGMVGGGLLTVPLLRALSRNGRRQYCARLGQNLLCSGWMIVGMAIGTVLAQSLALRWGGSGSVVGMLAGMFIGMVWGMVASVALYRGWFAWRERPAQR